MSTIEFLVYKDRANKQYQGFARTKSLDIGSTSAKGQKLGRFIWTPKKFFLYNENLQGTLKGEVSQYH